MRQSEKIIPQGYRKLQIGEMRLKGDKFFAQGSWVRTSLEGHKITSHDHPVIRSLKKEEVEIKKKGGTIPERIKKYLIKISK